MSEPLVKIEPADYGLTTETAANIAAQFQPMLEKMVELEEEFNRVVQLPIGEPDTEKAAKALLQKYVKVRTGTAAIHKSQKDFYLKGGRFVDGWKNAQLFASQGKEETLQKIVNHQEIQRRLRIQERQEERMARLAPYITPEDADGLSVGEMPDDTFEFFLLGKVQHHKEMMEAQERAEAERKKADELNRKWEQRRTEVAPVWKFADERLKTHELRELDDETYKSLLTAASVQMMAYELEQELAREELATLAREKQAALEAEARAEAERAAIAKAPIKEQLSAWVNSFSIPETSVVNETSSNIKTKFESFKNWALNQIESI